jgi:pyruvate formate lyase activating enzyme
MRIRGEEDIFGETVIIGGIQKVSLIDYPGKISAIIFTRGCTFRCPYCHNSQLVLPNLFQDPIPEEEVIDFLQSRRKFLDAVVITGGEPTLQKDLLQFMKRIKDMGYLVKLDSSGIFPDVLERAIKEKLVDYMAMDIKAPFEKYALVVGANPDMKNIRRSVDIIMHSGIDYEFRTTVVKSQLSKGDIAEIARSISGSKRYFLQKFVNSNTLDQSFGAEETYTDKEFECMSEVIRDYVSSCSVR